MPTYLRWIAAITSGVTAFFAYSILTLGLVRAAGRTELTGAAAGFLSLGGGIVMMIMALAINDWLIKRYPPAALRRSDDPVIDEQREDANAGS